MKSRERKRGVKGPWTCYTEPGDGPFPARAPNPGNKYGEEVKPDLGYLTLATLARRLALRIASCIRRLRDGARRDRVSGD